MKEKLNKFLHTLAIFAAIVIPQAIVFTCSGCNRQIFDTTWNFKKAHIRGISASNEWTTVEIFSWKDYVDGDVVQIKTKDGKTYLTHYNNVVLEAK